MSIENQPHENQPDNQQIDRILNFWFGETEGNVPAQSRLKLWFGGGASVDHDIRDKFETLVIAAEKGELENWEKTARGSLALIILLDQFPLNIYRKTARAFAFEASAVAVCKRALAKKLDLQLGIAERSFFYLPLEHSENIDDQNLSLELFQKLHNTTPQQHQDFTEKTLKYAVEHRQTIVTFGRYPYRNEVLGRQSTAAELAYLEENGSRYGQ